MARFNWLLAAFFVVLAAACSNETSPATPTPGESPAASPTAAAPRTVAPPEEMLGIQVRRLELRDHVPLPAGLVLYIESGCWGCDGPAAALVRAFRDHDGEVRIEDLYRLPGATISSPEVGGEYITSLAADEDGSVFLLGVCVGGNYCGGVGEIHEAEMVQLRWSDDGGVTWNTGRTVPGFVNVRTADWAPFGVWGLINRTYWNAPNTEWTDEWTGYPDLEPSPVEFRGQDPQSARVVTRPGGPLLRDPDGVRFYHLHGARSNPPAFDFSALPAGSTVIDAGFSSRPNTAFLTWEFEGGTYSGFTDHTPGEPATFLEIFRWPDQVTPFFHATQGGFVDEDRFVVAVPFGNGQAPAIVDLRAATISPIAELTERAERADRQLVKAIATGTFAQVSGAGEGSCLNVRERPELGAPQFACYAEGVLLREIGSRTGDDGREWLYVRTPSDREGWAAAEFLKHSGKAQTLDYHAHGTRTGNPTIAALEASATVPVEMIQWERLACTTVFDGFGGPPGCPEGVAHGTVVEALSGAACHGYFRVRDGDEPVRLVAGPGSYLHSVAERGSDPRAEWWPGDYILVYVTPGPSAFASAVYVSDGKVTADFGGCGHLPENLLEGAGAFVLPPVGAVP